MTEQFESGSNLMPMSPMNAGETKSATDPEENDEAESEAEQLISEFLATKGIRIAPDIEKGKPLASILKDYFKSPSCINMDYKKKTMELSFDIFCDKPGIVQEKQWFLRILKTETQV